jgi:peptidoglycan/xylan/chitin deacetylase (PgdA/CDA1 family)
MLTTTTQLPTPRQGALVISLDLELHWGVRDRRSLDRRERERLLLARTAALRIVELFEEFSVHATWAAVGFLFARSREDLERFMPSRRPRYDDPRLDPYREQIGRGESDDPFHFAPGLIDAIAVRTGQEIATHSFSHFYCCESGQGSGEFEADLRSALAIARESGYRICSCVFPRNQVNPRYLPLLKRAGILCYRGTQASVVTQAGSFRSQQRPHRRLLRLCDNYFDLYGAQTILWPSGPAPWSIGASRYLRPHNHFLSGLDDLRYRRIVNAMDSAAERGELLHLWWHPEDFAPDLDRNLQFLRRILEGWDRIRRRSDMLSLSMSEVVQAGNNAGAKVRATAGSST